MSIRKTSLTALAIVLALAVVVPATAQAPVWYIVTGSVTALANQSLLEGSNSFISYAQNQWKVRLDMELRLDAALMELKLRDPAHFDAVFDKYALHFNAETPSSETAVGSQ